MPKQTQPDNGSALSERESVLIEAIVKSESANGEYVTVEVPVYTVRVEGSGFEAAPVAVPRHCIRRKFTVTDEMVEKALEAIYGSWQVKIMKEDHDFFYTEWQDLIRDQRAALEAVLNG